MSVVRINRPEEETIEFFVDDAQVGAVNHSQHGWSAMDDIQCLVEAVATKLGAQIIYTEIR